MTKANLEDSFVEKMTGVYRPDEMKIGRMVSRRHGSNRCDACLELEGGNKIKIGFSNRHEKHADVQVVRKTKIDKFDPVYLPPKEFVSLYWDDKWHAHYETGKALSELKHNAIMEEFESLYDREQGLNCKVSVVDSDTYNPRYFRIA